MQLWCPSSCPIFSRFSPFELLFPNLKTYHCGRNFGSNEGVIDAVYEYLGDQEENFYFEGISKLEWHWWNSIVEREIILRNNGIISAPGHSQSKGAENFWSSLLFSKNYLINIAFIWRILPFYEAMLCVTCELAWACMCQHTHRST